MSRRGLLKAVSIVVLVLILMLPGQPVQADLIIVGNTNDSGGGSLRQAIVDANAPGPDIIFFDISGCGGVCVIQPTTPLPDLTDDGTTIAGYSQPDSVQATDTTPATILVQINGTNAGSAYGLNVTSSGNTISGLAVTNFEWDGIRISGSGATGNVVWGNYIGCDAGGTSDQGNIHDGVYIGGGASGNTIGGDAPHERNVISGNDSDGVSIQGSATMSNTVLGNYIGTVATVTLTLGNTENGIKVANGASNNLIGGDTPDERNIISGNDTGVTIQGVGTVSNTVSGNYIGTDVTGTLDLGNTSTGVYLADGVSNNLIGGDTPGERNIISGNNGDGVEIYGYPNPATHNTVSGNYIGTDAAGTLCRGNYDDGVHLFSDANYNTIGGDTPGERNVISCNGSDGMTAKGSYNIVLGNYIGIGADGTGAMGNSMSGIWAPGDHITVGPDNVIAHNSSYGVDTLNDTITRNSIHSNSPEGILSWTDPDLAILTVTLGLPINIIGTACAGCPVEIFENGDADGEGETYVGSAIAGPGGAFTVTAYSLSKPYLTATATDSVYGTSEFSEVFESGTRSGVFLPLVLRNH